jgi:hypothetical protein
MALSILLQAPGYHRQMEVPANYFLVGDLDNFHRFSP